jgi:hypothetical protein
MAHRIVFAVVSLILVLGASSLEAMTSGSDVLVAAAGRGAGQAGSMWITDLNVLNLGAETTTVEVFWLERNRPNPSPVSATYSLAPGAALILEDVILEVFGLESGSGAFRVVADSTVVVASRIYNLQDAVTFGQGFEGIPRQAAFAAGQSTDVTGLREDARFRSNIVLIDASDQATGSTVLLSLLDEDGFEIASESVHLRRLEPQLIPVSDLTATTFEYATLHAEVSVGSLLVAASKVDNDPDTGDPTTLEAWSAAVSADGTYQFAIYDSLLFAAGGNLVIEDGEVTSITATYFNWDKADNSEPECTLLFAWGGAVSPPVPVADFASGVEFETPYPDGGTLTYTLRFELDDSASLSGAIDAVGSSFTGIDVGCNGTFPELVLAGGKAP